MVGSILPTKGGVKEVDSAPSPEKMNFPFKIVCFDVF